MIPQAEEESHRGSAASPSSCHEMDGNVLCPSRKMNFPWDCSSLVDPVCSCVLPARQLLRAEPERDLLLGTLHRVTAMDHVPVGKDKGSRKNSLLNNFIKVMEPVLSYNIPSYHTPLILPAVPSTPSSYAEGPFVCYRSSCKWQ